MDTALTVYVLVDFVFSKRDQKKRMKKKVFGHMIELRKSIMSSWRIITILDFVKPYLNWIPG